MKGKLFVLSAMMGTALMASPASAIDMDIACPLSKTAGSSLTCKVTVSRGCWESAIQPGRVFASLAGNKDQTLGGIGLWGPFPRSATWAVVGNCSNPGNIVSASANVKIVDAVPASLVGVAAVASVMVEDKNSGDEAGSAAIVTIKAAP